MLLSEITIKLPLHYVQYSQRHRVIGPQFAEVFVIYWVGAMVVTLNIKLLGGNM
jgi:hypothetical protein